MALVTISEIADQANVSRSTVVRVLSKKGYVSEEKRIRVEQVIDELGYVPNKIAQGLKNQRTKMIGHIMPSSYPNPFFARISNAIEKSAHEIGYNVLTMITDRDAEREKTIVEDLLGRMVDGIIFTSTSSNELIRKVAKRDDIPIVMIERVDPTAQVDSILSDEVHGSFLAASHLIGHGHRKIAYIGHKPCEPVEKGRMEGYMKAVYPLGLDLDAYIKLVDNYSPEEGYRAISQLMEVEGLEMSAVFVGSDILAVGVLNYLYEKRIHIPDDLSVIGYDDTYSGMMAPQLTTVALPMEDIGRIAVELLLNRPAASEAKARSVLLSPYLIERQSVAFYKGQ